MSDLIINENTDPLDVFKPPFKQWWGIKIMTSDNRMAMDLCASVKDSEEFLQMICDILNGDSYKRSKTAVTYKSPYIYFDDNKIFLVRGWGYLTGCGGLRLNPELASKIQDKFADWVTKTLTKIQL